MVVMVIVIFYQVILRYVFNASNIWSEELARYLMCYSVLLGAAIAVRKYSHLQVDFVINMLPARGRCIAVSLCTLVGIRILGFFCQYGITLCCHHRPQYLGRHRASHECCVRLSANRQRIDDFDVG